MLHLVVELGNFLSGLHKDASQGKGLHWGANMGFACWCGSLCNCAVFVSLRLHFSTNKQNLKVATTYFYHRFLYLSHNKYKLKYFILEISKLLSKSVFLSVEKEANNYLRNLIYFGNAKSITRFVKFSRVSLVIIITLALLENTLFDFGCICGSATEIGTCSKDFYNKYVDLWWSRYGIWKKYIPNQYHLHEILAILKSIKGKLSLLVWNMGDVFAITLCRLIVVSVNAYKRDISLLFIHHQNLSHNLCVKQWEMMREKFYKMTNLFDKMVKFIYPLMISCYWVNISLVILKVSQ